MVADVGGSDWIVACDHNRMDVVLPQLLYCLLCFRLQSVLEDLKTIELQLRFYLLPIDSFPLTDLLAADGQNPKPRSCILLQLFLVILGN